MTQSGEVLDLGRNRLERIGLPGIGLRNLRSVWCDHNPLARIPELMLGLPAIQYLFLNNCALHEIPADIPPGWQDVRMLDVSENRITRVPGSYAELKSLFVLDDWGNPLEESTPGSLVRGVPGWLKLLDDTAIRLPSKAVPASTPDEKQQGTDGDDRD